MTYRNKEAGIVKSLSDNPGFVFVVYSCGGDWANYQNYTASLTKCADLVDGWNDIPTIGAKCKVVIEGVFCNAEVVAVHKDTFDAETFGTAIMVRNIPFQKFRPIENQ